MSTRSRIAIVLKEEDKGKKLFPKTELLYGVLDHSENENPILHESVFEKGIVSIYHHWDGYPDGVGVTLMKHYNDYEKVLNLMLMGDASTINPDSDTDKITFYNYWRNEDWSDVHPFQHNTVEELKKCVRNGWEEYLYIYQPNEDGKYEWYVTSVDGKMLFGKLKDVLAAKD